jgi:hypothetical protein
MAPRKKKYGSIVPVIPPIDPNSQLPFCGNYTSVVSESDLLHLVEISVLPSKELCSWWVWQGITVPTEDTHESVVFVPFLIHGLGLPVSPFSDVEKYSSCVLDPVCRRCLTRLVRCTAGTWCRRYALYVLSHSDLKDKAGCISYMRQRRQHI